MANVLIEEQTMKDIGNAIRLKSGTEKKLKPYEMPKAISDIPSVAHPEQYFKVPRYAGVITDLFVRCNKLKDFTVDFSEAERLYTANFAFRQTTMTSLNIIGELPLNLEARTMFAQNPYLVSVTGTPVNISTFRFTDVFSGNPLLQEIRFAAGGIANSFDIASSSKLSDKSIQSVIDGLVDCTGLTTRIIHFHTTVVKKLTVKQVKQITDKNWSIG